MIIPDIYKLEPTSTRPLIIRILDKAGAYGAYISPNEKSYHRGGGGSIAPERLNPVTSEEKEWFEVCERLGKFVELSSILTAFFIKTKNGLIKIAIGRGGQIELLGGVKRVTALLKDSEPIIQDGMKMEGIKTFGDLRRVCDLEPAKPKGDWVADMVSSGSKWNLD